MFCSIPSTRLWRNLPPCSHHHPSGAGFYAWYVCVYNLSILANVVPHFQEVNSLLVTSAVEGVLMSSGSLITTFWIGNMFLQLEGMLVLNIHDWMESNVTLFQFTHEFCLDVVNVITMNMHRSVLL